MPTMKKFGIEPKTIIREIHDILPREMVELTAEEEIIDEIEKNLLLKV